MKKIMLSLFACFTFIAINTEPTMSAFADGSAPVAENFEYKTYRESSLHGMLSASDPENDVVSFKITRGPVKGEIQLEQDGSFIYTPAEGKKGRDYFGYKVTDSQGNISQEATVIIRIEKQK